MEGCQAGPSWTINPKLYNGNEENISDYSITLIIALTLLKSDHTTPVQWSLLYIFFLRVRWKDSTIFSFNSRQENLTSVFPKMSNCSLKVGVLQ